ncbi:MAG: cytochrome c [Chitinophagaceae bacterium]|nr:cytochrome c [Chitinophagaceae bacterium]
MKQLTYIALAFITTSLFISSCGDKRSPGKIYMPDMTYSRAYEAYAELDSNVFTSNRDDAGHKIFYNSSPVAGTVKQGEMFAYTGTNDSAGYKASAAVKNPLGPLSTAEMAEAGRIYNINCGVCHGEKGTGNGPVASKIGAVANLTLPLYVTMADGTMFHSITYGLRNMGSYASQLDRKQRWMVIQYIRSLQPKGTTAAAPAMDSAAVATKK